MSKERLTVTMDGNVLRALRERAAADDRSLAWLVQKAVERYLSEVAMIEEATR